MEHVNNVHSIKLVIIQCDHLNATKKCVVQDKKLKKMEHVQIAKIIIWRILKILKSVFWEHALIQDSIFSELLNVKNVPIIKFPIVMVKVAKIKYVVKTK